MKSSTILGLISLLFSTLLWARDINRQNYLIGEKAAGMGGAFVSVTGDAASAYYNPAGLVQTKDIFQGTAGYIYAKPEVFARYPDYPTLASSGQPSSRGLLVGIAAVSLLVGGIGVMNIQLVSVAERTQEIGIRSAIGASPRQILVQFLTEAVVLSFTGSLFGVLLGWIASTLVAQAMAWSGNLSILTMAGAAAFGTSVGVAFGYLPARRAAQLEPIDALRHE